jgi:hypothetical protein
MKRLVPKGRGAKVQFFAARVAKWLERAEAIGADPALVAELAALVAEAQAAERARRMAERAARGATATFNRLVGDVERLGSCVVKQVRGRAGMADGNGVYGLAMIPPPVRRRSPIGRPGTPFAFKADLNGDGSLTISWKCKHPRGAVGTLYRVSRRVGPAGPFKFLAHVGEKRFVDVTVPRGSASVTYEVRATRSTRAGDAALFPMSIGGGIPAMMRMRTKRVIAAGPPSAPPAAAAAKAA